MLRQTVIDVCKWFGNYNKSNVSSMSISNHDRIRNNKFKLGNLILRNIKKCFSNQVLDEWNEDASVVEPLGTLRMWMKKGNR